MCLCLTLRSGTSFVCSRHPLLFQKDASHCSYVVCTYPDLASSRKLLRLPCTLACQVVVGSTCRYVPVGRFRGGQTRSIAFCAAAGRISCVKAMASKAELEAVPGVSKPDPATKDYIFQQTMYRIKDPKRSLDFYTRIIGFRLIEKLDFPDSKFSLYFLGYHDEIEIPEDGKERVNWMFQQPATLELTHNWGTESDADANMHNGNDKPQGYGHIGFHVPDVNKACERFEKLGVEFVKKPDAGTMKGLAFIKDPDGYWIEILNGQNSQKLV